MLVDSHAHLNFKAYKDDIKEVIQRCNDVGMKVINIGAAFDTSQKAVVLAKQEKNFYASLGLHPVHVYDEEFDIDKYQELIDKKVVAIGETGFDYFHLWQDLEKGASSVAEVKQKQEKLFRDHIKLARDNDLPLVIHGRNGKEDKTAYSDIYKVLQDENMKHGVIHCYGGNLEEAKKFVELGFHIGFTGILTFDNNTEELREIAKWVPIDKMLIETDSPYLTPVPFRGKRNEPVYVKYVAKQMADLRAMDEKEIIEITGQNAIKLFHLQ